MDTYSDDNGSEEEIIDEDDAGTYDSDSDDGVKPPRKRRRHDASEFFDRDAEESDESEEEYTREERTTPSLPAYPARDRNFAEATDEQLQRLNQRFESTRYNSDEDEEDDGPEFYGTKSKPKPQDPRIFKVACRRPGEESTLVTAIMERFISRAKAGKPLAACSAFCLDHVKGYVFVEAKNSQDVRQAIEGLLFAPKSPLGLKPEAIKLKDMIPLLKIPKTVTVLDEGSWVRVKRGLYTGDLAMVHRVDQAKGKAWIKLVPRLDFSGDNDADNEPGFKRKQRNRTKPPAVHFNRDDAIAAGKEVKPIRDDRLGENVDIMDRKKFMDGYLFKEAFVKGLEITNVNPSVEEVKKFQRSVSTEQIIASIGRAKATKKQTIARGDNVIVLHGSLANVEARVEEVQEDFVIATPAIEGFKDQISVEINNIRKLFQKGDRVQVISGTHKGETGLIVNIEEEVVTIYSHETRKTMQVLVADVQQCTAKRNIRVALKSYRLHDLVTIGHNSVGMITKVHTDGFTILETTGESKRVPLSDMGMKRNSHVSFDKGHNQITARDEVIVVEGNYKGQEGTVKYVYRHHLFIESPGFPNNGGFFVVRSNMTVASGKTPGRRPNHFMDHHNEPRSPFIDHDGNSRGNFGRGGRGRGRGGRGGRNDRGDSMVMPGKKVRIMKGSFKGYDGLIREIQGSSFRVELLARSKILSLPREDFITLQETTTNEFSHLSGGKTPFHGEKTPMIGDRTPMHIDRTPMHGERTPARDGDRSPDFDRSSDFSYNESFRTEPDYSLATPNSNYDTTSPYNSIATPMNFPTTPGGYDYGAPSTPYGQTVESPYNVVPTPQAYPSTPATPGLMMNPQTPSFGDYDSGGYDDALPVGVEVRISENFNGGAGGGDVGVITSSSGTPSVKLITGQTTYIPSSYLEVAPPAKHDRVKILRGKDRGKEGTVKQLNGGEAVVVRDDGDYVTIEITNLGKLSRY